jgi:AcrR family transcriptional regulator
MRTGRVLLPTCDRIDRLRTPGARTRQCTPSAPSSIVRTGIEMADAEALAALSMRRIAAELGVATMSLYQHVHSTDDVVLMMADAVLSEHPLPASAPPGWRAPMGAGCAAPVDDLRAQPVAGAGHLDDPAATS